MSAQWITTTRQQAWQNVSTSPGVASEVNLQVGDVRRQTWDGWGGCFNELGWIALSSLTPGKGMAQRVSAAWPGKKLMQTENECGDGNNTWEYAHYVFNLVHHYAINGAHAYVYWNMVLEPTGLSTWGWRQNAMVTVDSKSGQVTYNPEFYVIKHFSRFIAPGAARLETRGPLSANAVAFENPDGSRVVVVANPLKTERLCVLGGGQEACKMLLQPESFNTLVFS